MWNTWDTVTLQWTLTVPEGTTYATNAKINIAIDDSPIMPTAILSPSASQSPTLTTTQAPTQTIKPSQSLPTNTPTVKPSPTITPTKQPSSQFLTPGDYKVITLACIIAIIGIISATLAIAIKYARRKQVQIRTSKRIIGSVLVLAGVIAFIANQSMLNRLGFLAFPMILVVLIALNLTGIKRKHFVTMILCEAYY
jgi:hypothetical protein